jgi:aspartate-semialdehyde dehydrogenase
MSENLLRVAVAGATGAVGREMLRILEDKPWVGEVRCLASARSAGSNLPFRGAPLVVDELTADSFEGIDVALFSAGGSTSKTFAPVAAKAGALVVDNSSAFRMDSEVPLVVPEVNPDAAASALQQNGGRGIIANPNCSTIQMVVALAPLHAEAGLNRVIVSTYQSVSGAGQSAMQELLAHTRCRISGESEPAPDRFPHPIAFNAIPHIDVFLDNAYTREEMKMVLETRKIMDLPALQVSATCVRIPVMRAHSEAVTAEFDRPLAAERARELLRAAAGVVVVDAPAENAYPLPRAAESLDDTFVGRIREDVDRPATLHFWVVSDNLRKGAATNAVQIVDNLLDAGYSLHANA